mgnify:CR=1 FL=1
MRPGLSGLRATSDLALPGHQLALDEAHEKVEAVGDDADDEDPGDDRVGAQELPRVDDHEAEAGRRGDHLGGH